MSDTRRLVTIVLLDVAGYSARTEADEAKTTAEVAALRGVIETITKAHGGRVFNTAGDGFMLEFTSSLAAVEAAEELAGKCEPKVRVGVHLGDVVVQPNGDLLGHGVNVAARLMAKSDPGGVLVSADVRRTIRGPLAERLISRGALQLDKMSEIIEAFALVTTAAMVAATPPPPKHAEPLVAVLPFDNLSNDPDMGFFSDGVSEDIIQRLVRGARLKVVGRTSSFQFRGERKGEAGRVLKCTHVLDGSIRRAAGRVRVAAHLVETASQTTLWSDRFDRGLEDIFAIQDEISENIAGALNRTFSSASGHALDPLTYDLYLRAIVVDDGESSLSQIGLLEQVTARAPNFADGWGKLAEFRMHACYGRPYAERPAIEKQAAAEAERALRLDPQNISALVAQYFLLPPFGRFLEAEPIVERLHASVMGARPTPFADPVLHVACVGRGKEAVARATRMVELDALNPVSAFVLCYSYWNLGDGARARTRLEATLERWPGLFPVAGLLIILSATEGDWVTVDKLLAPERLARFPLREFERGARDFVLFLRDPTPQSLRRAIEPIRRRFEKTGCCDLHQLVLAAQLGAVDEAHDIAATAYFGPAGDDDDTMGIGAYRTHFLFHVDFPAFRRDPRFVRVCAKLGLVEYWLATQKWPDCVAELAPYYDFKAECEKIAHENLKQEFRA